LYVAFTEHVVHHLAVEKADAAGLPV